jgi:opacity protein-like surface antigen
MTTGYSEVLEPTSLSISANLGYNFGNEGEYRPFATIGFANVNFNESGTGTVYQDTSATAVRFGLGFEYTPSSLNGFGFRVAYEGDSFETTNTYGAEFKSSYNQTLALFYLGAQYKF